MKSTDELAIAYLEYFRTNSADLFWAYECVDAEVADAQSGLKLCMALIAACSSDEEIAYVAAGPLEDFIHRVGAEAVEGLEAPARQSEKIRQALSCVWVRESSPVYGVWQSTLARYL